MKEKSARIVAMVGFSLSLSLCVLAIALEVMIVQLGQEGAVTPGWAGALPGFALAVTGSVLMWRIPWHPIATVLLFAGVGQSLFGFCAAWINYAVSGWWEAPFAPVAMVVTQNFSAWAILAIPFALLLFPNGTLPAAQPWRFVAAAGSVALVAAALIYAAAPARESWETFGRPDLRVRRWDSDWGIQLPDGVWAFVFSWVSALMFVGIACAAISLIGRHLGADSQGRQQLRWISWSGVIYCLSLVSAFLWLPYIVGQILITLAATVVCVAILVAVTRYRLYSIDNVISWTLVYAILVVSVVAVDLTLVALVGGLVTNQFIAMVSVLVVFVAYAPLRERLLWTVGRLVNGRRGDPYGVISSLSRRLEGAEDPDDQLMHIARTVADTFASPYVSVSIAGGDGSRLVAVHGEPTATAQAMPLTYRGKTIGRLELAPGRRRMTQRDEQLLADLVRQAAAAVRATALSAELQSIREQLVLTREAERHRLRRDLHDGLGPALAAAKLRIETAKNVLEQGPGAAGILLDAAAQEVSSAITDVRRVAHDLRPPAIDDLGLIRATEQLCDRFGASFDVIKVPDALPPAIEVAAYRVVAEALTNAHRHSGGNRLAVRLERLPRSLVVEVSDNGIGIPGDAAAGVGLRSMRERAEEIGGSFTVTNREGGGTVVRAEMPLAAAEEKVDA
ncbi:histidine kinase [Cryobacterium sp. BB307]|uniref:sensor histidine kinase n=1 Tax=Cryobacterium sp. BB307 TaxID=2716317 RepID=UPI001447F722|nr:histidine kinase [Cryobacterium sp. BB307]